MGKRTELGRHRQNNNLRVFTMLENYVSPPPHFFQDNVPKKSFSLLKSSLVSFLFPSGSSHYYWITTKLLFCFASKEKKTIQKSVDELKEL